MVRLMARIPFESLLSESRTGSAWCPFLVWSGNGDRMITETVGNWAEYDFDDVVGQIERWGGNPNKTKFDAVAKKAKEVFEDAQATILSALSRWRSKHSEDKFLEDLEKE